MRVRALVAVAALAATGGIVGGAGKASAATCPSGQWCVWNDAALNNIYTFSSATDQYSWFSYSGLANNDDYASNRTTRTERVYDGVGQGMPLLYSLAPTVGGGGSNDGESSYYVR